MHWACQALLLPPTAFSGLDGRDPRLAILRSNDTLDIEACPGSGKTTLLVAKLAILARRWTARDQGVCVLSHTNAARREIEKRLGATSEGQRLLSYPHFVGTIHGFVNEYLALPWLRSQGFKIDIVDDELCLNWRWSQLSHQNRAALEKRRHGIQRLRYQDSELSLGTISWGKNGVLGQDTPIYSSMQLACLKSLEQGLFCHDEMFVWARDLLDKKPGTEAHLRSRFPLLFVDEVQDNSEDQSSLLSRIFIEGEQPVIRQRFGDLNQAIYGYAGGSGAQSDPFPNPAIRRDIPNSFRFGQSIASLANPVAVEPQGLVGQGGLGPTGSPELAGRHAIFLLDDDTVEHVLPSFARYLREELSPPELVEGDFTAVGGVHRHEDPTKVPHIIGHYWPSYDPGVSGADPQPRTLIQYLYAGRRFAALSGEAFEAVEKFAQGVLRLAHLADPGGSIGSRKRKHRHILELLCSSEDAVGLYQELVQSLVISNRPVLRADWEGDLRQKFREIVSALTGEDALSSRAQEFLEWKEVHEDVRVAEDHDNIYRSSTEGSPIRIRVGSVHSVKGETHTATLVLDTFYHAHHLNALKAWLQGSKSGGRTENDRTVGRMKLHYVAMTRPARLLCLAMRSDAFKPAEVATLIAQGWRVGTVGADQTNWH